MLQNIFKTFIGNVLFLVLAILMVSCGGGGSGSAGGGGNPVNPADVKLESITVNPPNVGIGLGKTVSYQAIGTYYNSVTKERTTKVIPAQWSSSNSNVATITESGLATGLKVGFATIIATYQGKSGNTGLTVSIVPPSDITVLERVDINPIDVKIGINESVSYQAIATYYDVATKQRTSKLVQAKWSSSRPEIARIVETTGVATGVTPGSTTIKVVYQNESNSTELYVNNNQPRLESVRLIPAESTISFGSTLQYHMIAHYDNGVESDVTDHVTNWHSSDTSIAEFEQTSPNGLVTALNKTGTTEITGHYDRMVSDAARLSVGQKPVTLQRIIVTVIDPTTIVDQKNNISRLQHFGAIGVYSDGSTLDITGLVTWNSSDPTVATIQKGGIATPVAMGYTNITATYGLVTSNKLATTLRVDTRDLTALNIISDDSKIHVGVPYQFRAQEVFGKHSSGNDINLDVNPNDLDWSTDNATVADIDKNGLLTPKMPGVVTVTAVDSVNGGIKGQITVTIVPSSVIKQIAVESGDSIKLNYDDNVGLQIGLTAQLQARATYDDGLSQDVTNLVDWKSSKLGVAVVYKGMIVPINLGNTVISADFKGLHSTKTVNVVGNILSVCDNYTESSMWVGMYEMNALVPGSMNGMWKVVELDPKSCYSFGVHLQQADGARFFVFPHKPTPFHSTAITPNGTDTAFLEYTYRSSLYPVGASFHSGVYYNFSAVDAINPYIPLGVETTDGTCATTGVPGECIEGYTGFPFNAEFDSDNSSVLKATKEFTDIGGWPYYKNLSNVDDTRILTGGDNLYMWSNDKNFKWTAPTKDQVSVVTLTNKWYAWQNDPNICQGDPDPTFCQSFKASVNNLLQFVSSNSTNATNFLTESQSVVRNTIGWTSFYNPNTDQAKEMQTVWTCVAQGLAKPDGTQDSCVDGATTSHKFPDYASKYNLDPYVKYIHKDLGINAYAFSVNDAIGGFDTSSKSGFTVVIGGWHGLKYRCQAGNCGN